VGVRIGGRIGPVSASTRLSSGKSTGATARVFITFIAVSLAILLVVTVAPVAIVLLGLWMCFKHSLIAKLLGAVVVVGGAVFAFWFWPREYEYFFRSVSMPDVSASSPASAKQVLLKAGFTDISFLSVDATKPTVGMVRAPLGSGSCVVAGQDPTPKRNVDKGKAVRLSLRCPLIVAHGYARVPVAAYADVSVVLPRLHKAGLNRVRVLGSDQSYCSVVSVSPAAGRVVAIGTLITVTTRC
jgi:hypothetical protein